MITAQEVFELQKASVVFNEDCFNSKLNEAIKNLKQSFSIKAEELFGKKFIPKEFLEDHKAKILACGYGFSQENSQKDGQIFYISIVKKP